MRPGFDHGLHSIWYELALVIHIKASLIVSLRLRRAKKRLLSEEEVKMSESGLIKVRVLTETQRHSCTHGEYLTRTSHDSSRVTALYRFRMTIGNQ